MPTRLQTAFAGMLVAAAALAVVGSGLSAPPAPAPTETETPTEIETETPTPTPTPTETKTPVGTANDQVFCDDDPDDGFECEPGMLLRGGGTVTPTEAP